LALNVKRRNENERFELRNVFEKRSRNMMFQYTRKDNTLYVAIIGAVDDHNTPAFKDHLQSLMDQPFQEVIFDFSQMQLICSSGIGRLLLFYRKVMAGGRRMRVKGVSDYIHNLFQFTNLDLLFPIEK